jgi:hypothetical protein
MAPHHWTIRRGAALNATDSGDDTNHLSTKPAFCLAPVMR